MPKVEEYHETEHRLIVTEEATGVSVTISEGYGHLDRGANHAAEVIRLKRGQSQEIIFAISDWSKVREAIDHAVKSWKSTAR